MAYIVIVTPQLAPGGRDAVVMNVACHLAEAGHRVDVLASRRHGEWYGEAQRRGISVVSFAGSSRVRRVLRCAAWLRSRQPDVVFINEDSHIQASIGLMPNRAVVVPVSHTACESSVRLACSNSESWNVMVCVSQLTLDMSSARVAHRPRVLITNGVPLPARTTCPVRREHGIPLKLLFVGRIQQYSKNVMALPEILRRCLAKGVECEMTVVGDGPDLPALRAEVVRLGLDQRLHMVGTQTPEKAQQAMLQSHVLVLPSFFEGLGLVVLEAMSCGCVPVATRLRGATDTIISDGRTGYLVDSGDTEAIAARIARLARNPAMWQCISDEGRGFVSGRHSVQAMGDAYLRLVADALAGLFPLPRNRSLQPAVDLRAFGTLSGYPPELLRLLSWLLTPLARIGVAILGAHVRAQRNDWSRQCE